VRKDIFNYHTNINTKEIFNTSKMVSSFSGIIVQPNKAIVGENAFAHESGIHQDGMLKNRETYEIMVPEDVGVQKTKIILGRHSGRHGLKVRLIELGYNISEDELQQVYEAFSILADKKKEVYDDDLRSLMGDNFQKEEELYKLSYISVNSGTNSIPTATVSIKNGEKGYSDSSTGDGAVDALFNAINRAIGIETQVESYQVRSVTSGREAMGEVVVRIRYNDKSFSGRGVSTDTIEASAKAYLHAINQQEIYKTKQSLISEEEVEIEKI